MPLGGAVTLMPSATTWNGSVWNAWFWLNACVTEPVAINATDAMVALSGVETVNGAPYAIDAGTDVIDGRGPLKRYGGEKISAVA